MVAFKPEVFNYTCVTIGVWLCYFAEVVERIDCFVRASNLLDTYNR